MNNKYLAIGLSIVAVLVVLFQVFLRKPDTTRRVNTNRSIAVAGKNTAQPSNRPAPTYSDEGEDGDESDDAEMGDGDGSVSDNETTEEIFIDIYSPQLLKKVSPYRDQWRNELPRNFGRDFTGYKAIVEMVKSSEETEAPRPELKLGGIIDNIKEGIMLTIINNIVLKTGETIENTVVKKIEKSRVILSYKEETIILTVNQGEYSGWIRKKGGKK